MRFQVPQFIEVEDKIFGPLTIKQFIYLAGGAGIAFVAYSFLPIYVSIIIIAVIVGFATALAFYKVNNKPFIFLVENAFKYALSNKLYIWKKMPKQIEKKEAKQIETDIDSLFVPKLSESKLRELTWSLDINENLNPLTKDGKQATK